MHQSSCLSGCFLRGIFLQLYKLAVLLHAYQTHCFKVVLLVPSNAKTDDRYKPSHSREDSQWKHELGKEQEPQWLLIKLCTYVILLHNFVIAVQWLTACKRGYTDWHVGFPSPEIIQHAACVLLPAFVVRLYPVHILLQHMILKQSTLRLVLGLWPRLVMGWNLRTVFPVISTMKQLRLSVKFYWTTF